MAFDRDLLESLAHSPEKSVVILGVGNVLKGDDGAGPLVCDALPPEIPAKVINAGTVPENYIQPILRVAPDALWIVDAVDAGAHPGQISLLDPTRIRMSGLSTHALSLRMLIDLLGRERAIDTRLIGIKAERTGFGEAVSPAVQAAIETLTATLIQIFRAPGRQDLHLP